MEEKDITGIIIPPLAACQHAWAEIQASEWALSATDQLVRPIDSKACSTRDISVMGQRTGNPTTPTRP
jgi:hypothetical protein